MQYLATLSNKEMAVQGIPIGRLAKLEAQVASLIANSFQGLVELSTTSPNGSQTTFAFTHTPKVILLTGQVQILNTDYTVVGNNITFINSIVPVSTDTVANIYA